jgi:hypothetical protein
MKDQIGCITAWRGGWPPSQGAKLHRRIVGLYYGVMTHQHSSVRASGTPHSSDKVEAMATLRHGNLPQSTAQSGRLAAWLLATALLAIGCTTSEVLGVRDVPPMGIGPQEAIAVLLRQFSGKFSGDFIAKEKEIVSCISDSILKAHPNLQIIPADEVRRAAFPDLAPEEIPLSPESLTLLLQGPQLRDRMAQMNVRYLIVVGGSTQEKAGPWGYGSGGVGAVGGSWDRRAHLSAALVDVRQNSVREVEVTATGHAFFGIVGAGGEGGGMAFPIIIPAFPESRACSDLGEAVAQLLVGAKTIQP